LLGDAEAAAEAAAVPDDVWEQLQLDTVGPVRWKQAVGKKTRLSSSRMQKILTERLIILRLR